MVCFGDHERERVDIVHISPRKDFQQLMVTQSMGLLREAPGKLGFENNLLFFLLHEVSYGPGMAVQEMEPWSKRSLPAHLLPNTCLTSFPVVGVSV